MATKNTGFAAFEVVQRPVRVKFKLKSGKTVSFKGIRTFKKKRTSRSRAKSR